MKVAATAITGTTTALAGVATAAIKVGSDFEAQMSRVQAISGAAGDELESLKNQAIQLGADTAFSAKEAAEGMENLAAAGFTTTEIMDAMPGMLNLAAAAGEDLAASSDIAASTLRGFGLEASDAAHVADVLAENANRTNSSVAETGEAMKYVAPLARAAGISMEETAAAIGIMANAGIQGSQAGTTLRGALSRLSKPTDAMSAAMEELGVSFYDSNGKMKSLTEQVGMMRKATEGMTDEQKNNYLVTLYGQEALSGMLALMNEGEDALGDLTDAYEACDGSAEKAAETMQDNLQGAIEQLGGSAESLGIIFYESVSDNLKDTVKVVNDSVDDITDAFTKGGLDKAIEQAGDEFADLAVMAAEHAPDMVDVAVDFIESFSKGISKNKKKLVSAAGEMAQTMASGLAELLPEELQAPVEKAIDAISESLSSGGLKNAGRAFADIFEDGLDAVGELDEVALPLLTDAIDFLGDNIEVIGPLVLGSLAAFEGYNAAVSVINAVRLAQEALNTAMTLSPVGVAVGAIAGLTVGLGAYMVATQNAAEAEYGLSEAQEKTIEKAQQLNDQYNKTNDARNESMAGIEAEYGHLTELKDELDTLIDTNGQVKQGYEDRANFIVGKLSSTLGMEKDQIWEIIDANGSLGDSIDQIIEKKKAEAILNANQDAYTEAIKKQGEALQNYQDCLETVNAAQEKYSKAQELYNSVMDNYYEMLKTSPEAANGYLVANNDIIAGCEEAKKAYETAKDALADSEEAYVGYNATIQNYEGLSSAIISGDSEKIASAMRDMEQNFITAETGTKESLERQVQNMRDNFTNLQQAVIDGTPGVTNQMVTSAQQMWTASVQELNKFQAAAGESTAAAGDAAVASFAQKNPDFLQAGIDAGLNADSGLASTQALLMQTAKNIAESSDSELGSADTKATGDRKGQEYNTGLSSTKEVIESTSESIAKSSDEKLGSKDTKGTGDRKGREYNTGLAGQKGNIDSTSQSIATSSDTILGSKDTSGTGQRKGTEYKSGLQSTQGAISSTANTLSNLANSGLAAANTSATGTQKGQQYVSGVNSQAGSANSAGRNLANNADSGARSTSGHSAGSNFGSGFVSGISGWIRSAASAAASLAKSALNSAKKALGIHSPSREMKKVGQYYGEGFELGIDDRVKAVEKSSRSMAQTALEAMDLSAISSRLRDVMSLNTGRISQAITGQTLNPQYYYNTEDQNSIDYDLIANKFASAVREKLKDIGIYMDGDKVAEIVTPGVSQRFYLYNKRGTT
nr:MAG TPA: minor tail protein [Caudoviricetes sp.]